jgi:competence protein ComEC
LSSLSISLLVISFGALVFTNSYESDEKELKLLDKITGQKILIYGKVSKIENFSKEKIQFVLDCKNLILDNKAINLNQRFLVNLDLRYSSLPLNYFKKIITDGNLIRISGELRKPEGPKYIGDFDNAFFLKSREINYIINSDIFDELNLIEADNSIYNFSRHLYQLREKIKQQIETNFDGLAAAYIKGLFIADRGDIPDEIKEDFINSGVIHVLAVSGLHTGYIALILIALSGRLNKLLKIIFVSIGLFIFVHIANLSPSVIRASLMSVIVLISLLIERRTNLLNSIALSALLILIFKPLDIFNPGFQLSFAAVMSIALIYPKLVQLTKSYLISGWKKYLIDLILISISVSIGTFPFVASYYQKFSLVALIANLIIIPLTGLILGGIILNLVVINFIPVAASIYKLALTELINFNFKIVDFFANLPFAYLSIKNFSFAQSLFYFLLVVLVLITVNRNYKPIVKWAIILLLIFDYFFFSDILSNRILVQSKTNLILVQTHNLNSILLNDSEKNFLKIFSKTDSLRVIANDFNKLDKIFWRLDLPQINYASISTPAIWLNNNLKKRLNLCRVSKKDDEIWLIGEFNKPANSLSLSRNSIEYKFHKDSYSEILKYNGWIVLITPVDFTKLKLKLEKINENILVIRPSIDTLLVKNSGNDFNYFPLDFSIKKMRIFQLNDNGIREIRWQ